MDKQDPRNKFCRRLLRALDGISVPVEDIGRAADDKVIVADLAAAFAMVIREHSTKTDASIDSVPTGRIIPANLEINLKAGPKLIHGQEENYHCRILPSWTFSRRQLGLVGPVERFGGVSGMSAWTLMDGEYGLLPNANILDVLLQYPSLIPAAWSDKRFYAFGTKIKEADRVWVRGLHKVRDNWEVTMERLDLPWVARNLVLTFQPSQ